MKLVTIILVVVFLISSGLALEKNESEAHKFLIDQGKVGKNSTIESFMIDKNGVLKIHILEGDTNWSFGLEENQDTYEIVKMKKRKQSTMSREKVLPDEKVELATKIGESLTVLKGGKVIEVRRSDCRKKSEV
jgi:hypothetical protein